LVLREQLIHQKIEESLFELTILWRMKPFGTRASGVNRLHLNGEMREVEHRLRGDEIVVTTTMIGSLSIEKNGCSAPVQISGGSESGEVTVIVVLRGPSYGRRSRAQSPRSKRFDGRDAANFVAVVVDFLTLDTYLVYCQRF
jgi:hypothetical protein